MAGTIPQDFIDELILRTDIVELVDSYIPLKKAGTNFTCCCPFHQEKTPSFNVIPHKQFFYCFGCGVSGNAIKFLMMFLHLPFPEAVKNIADKLGVPLPTDQQTNELSLSSQLQGLLNQINNFYKKSLYQRPTIVVDYVKKRQLNKQVIEEFQLGYAPPDWQNLQKIFPQSLKLLVEAGMIIPKEQKNHYFDRFRNRLMFPLHNRQGKLIGFGGRVLDDQQKPKYMNSPETVLFHKQKELYGLYQVIHKNPKPEFVIVVEGYMDVISLFQYGLPYAVATMGTASSHYHLQTLHKYTDNIIFCFDGDAAGRQAAWRALENALPLYNQMANIKFLLLPDAHDPDSYIRAFGSDTFKNEILKAQSLHAYFAHEICKQFAKSGTQKLILELQKYLQHLDDGPGKELIYQEIAKLTRLESYRIAQWVNQPHTIQTQQAVKTTTPMRLAMALLIQNPPLHQQINTTLIEEIQTLYPEPLGMLLKTILDFPEIKTASLVEHFRDHYYFEAFNKLAVFEHQIQEDQQASSLSQIIEFLIKQSMTDAIDELMQRLKKEGLGDEDKIRLQELLQKRQIQKI